MIGEASGQKTDGSGADVVLNLSSVPLQQAAKTVLGDMIGVNYVVDPRVDGVITCKRRDQSAKLAHWSCSRQRFRRLARCWFKAAASIALLLQTRRRPERSPRVTRRQTVLLAATAFASCN